MIFIKADKSVSRHEIIKINKIKAKIHNKRSYSGRDSSSSDYDYDSCLYSDSEWEELIIQTTEHRDINNSDQLVTNNTKKNKIQQNYAIEYAPDFDKKIVYLAGLRTPH